MKRGFDHRNLHLLLVGIIIVGFVAFSLFNIFGVFSTTGNPILKSSDNLLGTDGTAKVASGEEITKPIILPYVSSDYNIDTYMGVQTRFAGVAGQSDAEIVLYQWDFNGDNIYDYSSTQTGIAEHTYSSAGSFKAKFHAVDEDGLDNYDWIYVNVLSGSGTPSYVSKTKTLPPPSPGINPPLAAGAGPHTYVVMINAGGEDRFWTDVDFTYNTFLNDYGIPAHQIYLLNTNGLNPSGMNPNGMIDYPADTLSIVDVFETLRQLITPEDTLFVWIDDHGTGYFGEKEKAYGFTYQKPEVDPQDEQDYVESNLKLRSLYTSGTIDGGENHGMNKFIVMHKIIRNEEKIYRRKFVSSFTNLELENGTKINDSDLFLEVLYDYLKGDYNRDGYINTSAGEVIDYDGDGREGYYRSNFQITGPEAWEFDEDDRVQQIDYIEDDFEDYHMPYPGTSYQCFFDAGFDNKMDIDINCACNVTPWNRGLIQNCDENLLEVDGTDLDNNGLFEGVDVNDDGDMNDWVSIDEAFQGIDGAIYDDYLKEMLAPIDAKQLIVFSETCFGGGIIDDLSAPNRIVLSASEEETSSYGNEFVRELTTALKGEDIDGNTVNADINSDGKISFLEAFNYATQNDWNYQFNLEIPQYDDNGDGQSHTEPLPNNGDGVFGSTVFLESGECAPLTCEALGKECGLLNDQCGSYLNCGSCGSGTLCSEGICVQCTPKCTGKECGSDGCGGSCGLCTEGYQCDSKGVCSGISAGCWKIINGKKINTCDPKQLPEVLK